MSTFRCFLAVTTVLVLVSTTHKTTNAVSSKKKNHSFIFQRRERGLGNSFFSASRESGVKARKYRILKQTRGQPKVELIHITKTGGSALEAAAADAGITWGACHYRGDLEKPHCNKITNREAFTHSKKINELAVNLNNFNSHGAVSSMSFTGYQ
ncbi:predicted protein [Chaetoceros tenuissimus]|uniref:Uncharacterized protein n=1 Tax=Chaetoceros tenuissimus TaxID=426638 RepID=A0AAD3CK83_9STRA|nr:predicted protein [Chaetoceros tenuissimus]